MNSKLLLLTGVDKRKLISKLQDAGQDLAAVFVPDIDKYRLRYAPLIDFCEAKNIRLISGAPSELYDKVKSLDFDVVYSCAYPFKVPSDLISRAKHAINFHPTLLPRHRGRYLHWIILDGDKESGVTAHFMDANYDTGPIIRQMTYPVSKFDTVESLLRKSFELEWLLAVELLDEINQDRKLGAVTQDEETATEHFAERSPKHSQINPTKTLLELYNEIRVCDSDLYPAYFEIEGQKVGIKMFRLNRPDEEFDLL